MLTVAAPAIAQQRLGSEFQVNSYTTGNQYSPAVASDAEGNFVVVWGGAAFGGISNVSGQRYDASGNPLGNQFLVNTYTTGRASSGGVASDAEGNFVVVWRDIYSSGVTFARRYDASGTPLGEELLVGEKASLPILARAPGGDFVVVWRQPDGSSLGVFGQRYDAAGNALGGEFQVNTFTTGYQWYPAVAFGSAGEFVVVWESFHYQGSTAYVDIFGQRYDSAGNPIGGEFRVNTYTPYDQRGPDLAIDDDGDFMVVWRTVVGEPCAVRPGLALQCRELPEAQEVDVFGQRFDSAGNRVGGELQVSSNYDTGARVTSVADDEFMVVWEGDWSPSSDPDVLGRRFDASGAVGGEFLVNTHTKGWQYSPNLAADSEGRFVVVWLNWNPVAGLARDVFGQRFAGPGLQLSADGTCPGEAEVTLSSAPPNSEVAVLAAANTNGFTKGGTLCSGTELELGEPFALPPTFILVDDEGNGTGTLQLPENRCWIQALALADCQTSNTALVP